MVGVSGRGEWGVSGRGDVDRRGGVIENGRLSRRTLRPSNTLCVWGGGGGKKF